MSLAVLALGMAVLGGATGARAGHGPDASGWIQQMGNGHGASAPIIPGLALGTVLFDNNRFATRDVPRGFPKFLAWGGVTQGTTTLLAVSRGSDDGLRWERPTTAVLRDPDTQDVPFVLDHPGERNAVVYNRAPLRRELPFSIYYLPAGGGNYHVAFSLDGAHWFNDTEINVGGDGPSQVILQPHIEATTCDAAQPFTCRYVMLHSAGNAIAVAASADGIAWQAGPVLLSAGSATAWDGGSVAMGHLVTRNGSRHLYYSGASSATCPAALLGCYSIGAATSVAGSFVNAAVPGTPASLFDSFSPAGPVSLRNPQAVLDASGSPHAKIYYSVLDSSGRSNTFLASTSPQPFAGPNFQVFSPERRGSNSSATPIDVYVADGGGGDLDLGSFALEMDGAPVSGATITRTLVTAYRAPAFRITVPGDVLSLPDGAHTFTVSGSDVDGNTNSATVEFFIDTTAPVTVLSQHPTPPRIGFPMSMGTFGGNTKDTGFGIARLRASVTDPLGRTKVYESTQSNGWLITQVSKHEWEWKWIAPSFDPHFLIPGTYIVTVSGVDGGGTFERPTVSNTKTVEVL